MFGLAIFPALGLGMGMFFLPDSPRSLINRGYKEKAKQVLIRIYGRSEEGLMELEKISRSSAGGSELSLKNSGRMKSEVPWMSSGFLRSFDLVFAWVFGAKNVSSTGICCSGH